MQVTDHGWRSNWSRFLRTLAIAEQINDGLGAIAVNWRELGFIVFASDGYRRPTT